MGGEIGVRSSRGRRLDVLVHRAVREADRRRPTRRTRSRTGGAAVAVKSSTTTRRRIALHPARRRQHRQPEGGAAAAARSSATEADAVGNGREVHRSAGQRHAVRPGPDGLPDAGDGRVSRRPRKSGEREAPGRRTLPIIAMTAHALDRRSREVPRGRHGRLHQQAGEGRRAGRRDSPDGIRPARRGPQMKE